MWVGGGIFKRFDREESLSVLEEAQAQGKGKAVEEVVAERLQGTKKEDLDEEEEVEVQVRKLGEWGYKTVKEKAKKGSTKEELLDMRVKK
eukprot:CAMPEP_0202971748 /NCGR_PEP_ID=MMETSP1396-20130829/30458_1 /ASSEMBLY_ACC=CAM_ASM_000872 /TAXON_ID= /ORGANISM="Pseudokeronopsis sp., Strain Brazil" /LENGTH=89 /DNA_ID=CAMNT_0049701463 /DNA_START=294 /DNA_END=561 /DNA_ORIENTATION=+